MQIFPNVYIFKFVVNTRHNQLELTEVHDDLTCTQILQQWHVPKTSEVSEPILYEDMTFEALLGGS